MFAAKNMIQMAVDILPKAHAPYSGFAVAACLESDKGQLFAGVNIENIAYGLCICAESSAISQMIGSGDSRIVQLLVLTQSNQYCLPCGACRQRIYEFSSEDCLIHIANQQQVLETLTIGELLPRAFSFKFKADKP